MDKSIKNVNKVACKLKPVLTRTTNYKLEIASKKKEKREEMVKR